MSLIGEATGNKAVFKVKVRLHVATWLFHFVLLVLQAVYTSGIQLRITLCIS
jgi:hypothetical protein